MNDEQPPKPVSMKEALEDGNFSFVKYVSHDKMGDVSQKNRDFYEPPSGAREDVEEVLDRIVTLDTPSFEEYERRYVDGYDLSIDESLRKNTIIQKDIPYQIPAIGSIASHPEVYGGKKMRTTDHSFDYVAGPDVLQRLFEEYDFWRYGNCVAFEYVCDEGERWAIGIVPTGVPVFHSDPTGSIVFTEDDVERSWEVDTSYGPVQMLEPETVMASKAKRLTDRALEKDHVRNSDPCDFGNMVLAHAASDRGVYDVELLTDRIHSYTDGRFPEIGWREHVEGRLDNHVREDEKRIIGEELDRLEGLLE